jgi:hypothetical protein
MPTSFISVSFSLTKLFNMAKMRKFNLFLGHAEPLCVEFCNLLHCRILVNSLSSLCQISGSHGGEYEV